jgi:thiol-disulfide isomerase/thioredoxin
MKRLAALLVLAVGACNPAPPKGGISTDATSAEGAPLGVVGARAPAPAVLTPAGAVVSAAPSAGAKDANDAKRLRVRIIEAATDTDALSLVRTERLRAKAEGRVLVVYVGAVWCPPCRRFHAELASGKLDARLARVTLLSFDADRDVDRLGAAGYSFKFVPFIALPGADGRPSDSVQATGKGEGAWQELLTKLDAWQA